MDHVFHVRPPSHVPSHNNVGGVDVIAVGAQHVHSFDTPGATWCNRSKMIFPRSDRHRLRPYEFNASHCAAPNAARIDDVAVARWVPRRADTRSAPTH